MIKVKKRIRRKSAKAVLPINLKAMETFQTTGLKRLRFL